jgi:hypothetical protein
MSFTRFVPAVPILLLFSSAFLLTSANGQSSPVRTAHTPDAARPFSYVYLDPLEGHHGSNRNDGNHVGIEMHGHWVIDVKNPDGSVAEHRDFENTIQNEGAEFLVGLMAGYTVPSDYGVTVQPPVNGTAPCALNQLQGCGMVRSLTNSPGYQLCSTFTCTADLTYTPTISMFGANSFMMAGSFTATQAGTISNVQTWWGTCVDPSTATGITQQSPSTCRGGSVVGYYNLSAASITAMSVVASQIVQVTVTISFS